MSFTNDLTELAPHIHQAALDPHLPIEKLNEICDTSRNCDFSGFCTNLARLSAARERLGAPGRTKLIAVIAFPFGFITSDQKQAEAEWAAEKGAEELDVVPNFYALAEGKADVFANELAKICEIGLPIRVILDIANIPNENLSVAIEASIDAGVHGLQTGTGFGRGVIASDVHQLSNLARGRCEIKAVGGIKTDNQALELIKAGAKKIGTTTGPQLIQNSPKQNQ